MEKFVRTIIVDGRPVGYFCLSGISEPIKDLRQAELRNEPFYNINNSSRFEPYIYIKQVCIEAVERGKGYEGLQCNV